MSTAKKSHDLRSRAKRPVHAKGQLHISHPSRPQPKPFSTHLLARPQHRPIHPLAARVHRVPPFAVVEAVHRLGADREARLHETLDVPVCSMRVAAAAGCVAGKQAAGGPLHVPVKREQLRGRVLVETAAQFVKGNL